jgi:nucleotidyltransferase/DNA polymerase involved in DNA repair
MQLDTGAALIDPGPFRGAFYFFHLDKLAPEDDDSVDVDAPAAAGVGIARQLLKDMTGISILRDGFRVRSQGDWLGLSQSMTSGSTYGMRVDNTVGYFALTGEHNYKLVEKSDRDGFVEDPAYRGFMQIAKQCRGFANESLEQVRRALDDYYKRLATSEATPNVGSLSRSFQALETGLRSAEDARAEASRIAAELQADIERLERDAATRGPGPEAAGRALTVASRAITAMHSVQDKLAAGSRAGANLIRLRQEPVHEPKRLARLLCDKIESLDPGFGIGLLRLAATSAEPLSPQQATSLLVEEREADVSDLIDTRANRVGAEHLYRLAPLESDIPERSVKRIAPAATESGEARPEHWPRPVRLFPTPEPIETIALLPGHPPTTFTWRGVRRRVKRADGPERIFGEWWKRDAELTAVRDYFRVEDEAGERFWLFRASDGEDAATGSHCWFIHGIFG